MPAPVQNPPCVDGANAPPAHLDFGLPPVQVRSNWQRVMRIRNATNVLTDAECMLMMHCFCKIDRMGDDEVDSLTRQGVRDLINEVRMEMRMPDDSFEHVQRLVLGTQSSHDNDSLREAHGVYMLPSWVSDKVAMSSEHVAAPRDRSRSPPQTQNTTAD